MTFWVIPQGHESGRVHPSSAPHRPPHTGTVRKPRVLIVDDNDEMRELFAWCMRAAGWAVEDVANGVDALAVASTFEPDVIVMDLHLPYIDGLTVTRRLKRDPRTAAVPVVACSAYVDEHAADLVQAGFAAVVSKPCTAEALRDRLERIVTEGERGR